MTVAIMQPYFLPYIGYWQLMNVADVFVVYDNIQFSRKGWIHRNRMLQNGKDAYFSLPLKKDSDYLDVCDRYLSDASDKELGKIKRQIEANYRKSPSFSKIFPIIESILDSKEKNLFNFLNESLLKVREALLIKTKVVISSTVEIDHSLRSQDKVLAICSALNATEYINPIGGIDLYRKEDFAENGITLKFLKSNLNPYPQFKNEFIPGLSILDVLMFNSESDVEGMMKDFELIMT